MQTRNQLGSQIYRDLISADLDGALRNPTAPAQRALMLADAFLLCAGAPHPPSSEENALDPNCNPSIRAALSVLIETRDISARPHRRAN